MRTVLFDIDGTLFDANSTFDFLDGLQHGRWYQYYRRVGRTLLGRVVNKLSILIFRKDIIRMIGIRCLKNYSHSDLQQMGEIFYENFLKFRSIPEIIKLLNKEKTAGSRVILASATLDFLAEIIKCRVGASACFGTELMYNDGICTGKIQKDRLGHKMDALKEMGVQMPVDLMVTDNVTDVELLRNSLRQVIVVYPRENTRWKKMIATNHFENVEILRHE